MRFDYSQVPAKRGRHGDIGDGVRQGERLARSPTPSQMVKCRSQTSSTSSKPRLLAQHAFEASASGIRAAICGRRETRARIAASRREKK